ncbi:RidA family protein [uncultured Tateyamaria sp.]|uniref:RidA family protein n=1 Tax=Tateyamaria sp. 1078 TaxID=3417464 RepID=UPI0026292341|nr:RidA family protein [uncultured Tateyamaria sp.]
MTQRAIYPAGLSAGDVPMKLSPAILSHGHLFLTGMTGSLPGGAMPDDPQAQFRFAFDKISNVLSAAGASFADVIEMTTYHVDLHQHFDTFEAVHATYVTAPYPAWTAVEVSALRRPGALVEIRVIAQAP